MIRRTAPAGFTLVELLVAIALAVVMLGLAVGLSQSTAFDSYKTVGAADKLSQWLIAAKSKALRDKAPRGIRLIPDTANPEFIREIAYIEQPDPIPSNGPMLLGAKLILHYPVDVSESTSTMSTTFTQLENLRGVYLGGLTAAQQASFRSTVQPGDMISIPELRTVLLLRRNATTLDVTMPYPGLGPQTGDEPLPLPAKPSMRLEVLVSSLPDLGRSVYSIASSNRDGVSPHPNYPVATAPTNGTITVTSFSIIRAPRPILGEPTQQLPNGMAVDLRTSVTTSLNPPPAKDLTSSPPNYDRDILFAPTGEVIGATEALSVFLMRDVNLPNVVAPLGANYDQAGQQILICVYNKTGAIATQPVNPPPTIPPPATYDPYRFARDGINTGL